MGGTTDPCAVNTLQSIGMISEELNVAYTAAITTFINQSLGIAKDRYVLPFSAVISTEKLLYPSVSDRGGLAPKLGPGKFRRERALTIKRVTI